MSWEEIRLEEIADFRNGVNFTNDSFGKGIKVINVADFKEKMYPDYGTLGELDVEAKWSKECFLEENDIVFVRSNGNKNLIGRSIFIKNLPENIKVTYSAFSIRLRFKSIKDICPEFYLYLFKSPIFRSILSQYGNGANISNLNQDILNNMIISRPPLPIQHKIVDILSSYDNLIENNNQRIKLLEEMAEEIYKEWFVRMRFPGYETATIVDGLPEGWVVKSFEEAAYFINGFAFKPSDWKEKGLPIVKISELKNGITINTPRNDGKYVPKKLHVKQGELLFSWSADLDAYIWYEGKALLNQHIFKVVPFDFISKEYLFFSLKNQMGIFKNMSNGATMHHIKRQELGRVFLSLPNSFVLESFTKISKPLLEAIGILIQKNQLIQQTRDLLLPRLISGKLSVEYLVKEDVYLPMAAEPESHY